MINTDHIHPERMTGFPGEQGRFSIAYDGLWWELECCEIGYSHTLDMPRMAYTGLNNTIASYVAGLPLQIACESAIHALLKKERTERG